MADKRTAEILLTYSIDNAAANRVRQSFKSLEYELGDLRSELTGVGTSAQQGVNGLRQRFAAGESAVESMQSEVEQLRAELLALDNVTVKPTVDVQRTGAAGGNSGLVGGLNTLDQIGRIGSQVGGGLGAGALGNSVNLIGDIAGAAATMNPVLIAATAAIGAMSIVGIEFTRSYEEAKKAAENYLAIQTEINLLLVRGDIEGLRAKAEDLQSQIEARSRSAARLQPLIDRFDELDQAAGALLSGLPELNQTGLTYEEILKAQEQVIEDIGTTTEGQITSVAQARESVAGFREATADLSGELALTKIALDEVALGLDGVADKSVDFINKTALALDNAIKASKDKGIGGGIQGGIGSGLTPFQDSQAQLNAALQTTRTDSYLSAVTKTIEAQQALTVATLAYNEAVAASEARISDITSRMNDDLAAAESERLSELADAEQKASDDRKQIVRDTAKELARIEKRAALSKESAVAERDALAAKRAEQQRDQEIEQLQDRYTDQKEAVDKSLAAQQKTIQSRYEAQVKTVRAAADAAIRLETQRAQAELSVRKQALQAAQTQMINAANAELMIRSNLYNQSISQAQIWANTMQMYIQYGLSIPGGTGTPKMPTPIIGKWAGGSVVPGQTYVVGEKGPELFQTPVPGRIIPNGASSLVTINLAGAQMGTIKATSRQQVLVVLNKMFDGMGVA